MITKDSPSHSAKSLVFKEIETIQLNSQIHRSTLYDTYSWLNTHYTIKLSITEKYVIEKHFINNELYIIIKTLY